MNNSTSLPKESLLPLLDMETVLLSENIISIEAHNGHQGDLFHIEKVEEDQE